MKNTNDRRGFPFLLILIIMWSLNLCAFLPGAFAEEVQVAVASNFYSPFKEIARSFQTKTGNKVQIISGSTGKIYAQIIHGAPFHMFLAADSRRPMLLEKEGFAVAKTRFTYALGKITLWSPDPDKVSEDGVAALQKQNFNHIAIANPKTAPYGKAALQTLQKLNLWDQVKPFLVQGENINQTFQFVATHNADLGFVALSQVLDPKNKQPGKRWDVPAEFYTPLEQDVVILKKGKSNPAARALWEFLRSGEAKRIIERYGYKFK